MKRKKWYKSLKCLLMAAALVMTVSVAAAGAAAPAKAEAKTEAVRKGTKFWKGKLQYKVTSLKGEGGTAALVGTKSKNMKSVKVPETVKKGGYTLAVTEIGAGAFRNCRKLKKVTTNTKIEKIGKSAFAGCRKLASVDIKSRKLKKVGKNALKGVPKGAVVTAPEGMAASYSGKLGVAVKTPTAAVASAPKAAPEAGTAKTAEAAAETGKAKTAETAAETGTAPGAAETASAAEEPGETLAAMAATEADTEAMDETEAETETEEETEIPTEAVTEPEETAEAATEAGTEAMDETEAGPETEEKTEAPTEAETEEETEIPAEAETKALKSEEACGENGHVFVEEWKESSQPTCAEPGTKTRTCKCGKAVEAASFGAPTGAHEYQHIETAATCEKDGFSYDVCETCGKKINETTIPSKGHDWVRHEKSATCTESGVSYVECSRCGKRNGTKNYTSPKGHKWGAEKKVVPSTCSTYGREYEVCENCGATGSYTLLPKTEHTLKEREAVPATCTEDGYTVWECTNTFTNEQGEEAHCSYTRNTFTEKAKGHSFKYEVTKRATCKDEGTKVATCVNCGYRDETTIPRTDHHWILKPDRNGLDKCADCGKEFVEPSAQDTATSAETDASAEDEPETNAFTENETEMVPKLQSVPKLRSAQKRQSSLAAEAPGAEEDTTPTETEHVCEFDWVVTEEPVCSLNGKDMAGYVTGSRTGTCSVCGRQVTEGLRAEHQYVDRKVEPTCTTRGVIYSTCSVCGRQVSTFKDENGNSMPALGHDMQHHEEPATCTEDARSYDKCSRCGRIENEAIKKNSRLGHDFTDDNTVSEGASFFSAGGRHSTAKVVKAATCTQRGVVEYTCQHDGCQATRTESIPATGHVMSERKEIPATYTDNKKVEMTCVNCGYKETDVLWGTKLQANEPAADEPQADEPQADGMEVVEPNGNKHDWISVEEWNRTHPTRETSEGALASMSFTGETDGKARNKRHGRIRTEICSIHGLGEQRYAYHIKELSDECGSDHSDYEKCTNKEHWIPWSQVPCNGKGHTWPEEGADNETKNICTVCGMTMPEKDDGDPASSAARIVWSVYTEIREDGRTVEKSQPTAISASNHIMLTASDRQGYRFTGWTWSKKNGTGDESTPEDIPKELYKNPAAEPVQEKESDNRTLYIPCSYMNVTFIAQYQSEVSVSEQTSAAEPDAAQAPQVIHGELHLDLSEALGDDPSAQTHEQQEHTVIEHDPILEEGDHVADAGAETPAAE